jgi:GT2 family glycosyltransferase
VTVVDGASGDDSCEKLRSAIATADWSAWVELLELQQNRGFAAGNNRALERILAGSQAPDLILLLNPDTIVRPGGIAALVAFMEEHPEVGIVGSRLENLDGSAQRSAFRFHSVWGEVDTGARWAPISRLLANFVVAPETPREAQPIDWVCGASMMVRRQVFSDIGLLDENFFMYYEEVDFCRRARSSGWNCWYQPASRVVHLVGQASGLEQGNLGPRRLPAYWFESRRRYYIKHHGLLYAMLADTAWITTHAMWRIRARLQRKPRRDPPYLLRDFILQSALVRGARFTKTP